MALYRYFKPVPKNSKLSDPEAARSEASKHGSYVKLTAVQLAQIARFVFSHSNKEAIRCYIKTVLCTRNCRKLSHYMEIQIH